MKKILAIALAIAALPALAVAQSSPNLTKGQVLTAGQWNALFVGKQDTLGFIPLNTGGGSMSGRLITAPPGATLAGFNLTPGTAPASPADGDMWATSLGLYVQVSGSTVGPMTSAATPCTNCAVTNATNTFLNNQIVNLGGGAAPAAQAGMILQGVGAPATTGRLEIDTFAAATIFTGIRADGTVGAPTTLVANDEIVSVNAWGYDGTSRAGPAAGIRQFAAGTWSNTNHPTFIDFVTTPAASTTLTTRLRVESDGGLTINGATSGGLGSISGVDNSNRAFSWSMTNTSAGVSAAAQLNFVNLNGSASFGTAGSANSNASLANKAFVFSATGLGGIALYTGSSTPIDFYVNNVRAGGFTTAGALDLGLAGTAVGSVVLHNVTSGGVTLSPVAGALGAVTINVPAAAGTMAVSATAPVTLSAAGAIGCSTCLTSIALTGDVTGSGSTSIATTLATVNSNVGTFGSATQASQVTVNGKGLVTAAANVTVTPAVGSITGFGSGVGSALAVGVNGSGGLVTFNGTLGTPTSGTVTNLTGTASININGTVGATTPSTGAFTTVTASSSISSPTHTASGKLTFSSNGATQAGFIDTSQQWYIGPSNVAVSSGSPRLTVSNNTGVLPAVGGALATFAAADTVASVLAVQSFGSFSGLYLTNARGTAAAPTATQSADAIGLNFYLGYNGTTYVSAGGLGMTATQNWTGSNQGARLDLYATADTGATAVAQVHVQKGLMIGNTNDPGAGAAMLNPQAFASLAACSGTTKGAIASVTDSNTVVWGASIAGSSTNPVLAFCNGTAWTVAGK